jgi:hypothetical protein
VPLLLIDRAGAFTRWAREFAAAHGRDKGDAEWLVTADGDGFTPGDQVAAMIAERFGLNPQDEGVILAELRAGLISQLVPDDAVTQALHRGRRWPRLPFKPDHRADSFADAVDIVLAD